jgi:cyclopropane-fatty-acyl-phospholipid synthase
MTQVAAIGHSSDAQRILMFLDQLLPVPRNFAIRLWDGTFVSGSHGNEFTLAINSPGALRRMFEVPLELKMGEAFCRGDFDIEGESFALARALRTLADLGIFKSVGYIQHASKPILALTRLLALVRLWLSLPTADDDSPSPRKFAYNPAGKMHSKERDRAAVEYHYDFGNEFYTVWLGKRMQYSCNYYPTGAEDIDTAEALKLEHLCRKLRLKPGERLLDIGCGWGGMVMYAAQHFGVRALGVTLSNDQYQLANERIRQAGLQDRVEVKRLDYRDVPDQQFDKVVSVEMCEHVGHHNLPLFFQQVYRLLKPGGLLLNQTTCTSVGQFAPRNLWTAMVERALIGRKSFTSRYVLPDGATLPISQMNWLAQKAGFEVQDVENIRRHYVYTLKDWVRNLEAHEAELVALIGRQRYRVYQLYLYSYIVGFDSGAIDNHQSLFAKPGGLALPMTRADVYA